LRAVSTNRPDSEETAAQAFGISASFDKYRELLRHPGVDLVVVAVNGTLVSNAHHNQ
jgi:predicted dehydrogenase